MNDEVQEELTEQDPQLQLEQSPLHEQAVQELFVVVS